MSLVHACRILALVLLGFGAAGASAAEPGDPIRADALDEARLARAIFEETNRVRAQLGLKPFGAEPKLDDAAGTQARLGSVFRPPSHTNPFPLIATPLDRVKFAGLDPEYVAENIARIPIYDLPRGTGVYHLKNDPTLRETSTGRPARVHTYESFARAVVEAWMNSPGHRENIVSTKLHFLGCAVKASRSQDGIDMIFAVQAFYTPKAKRAAASPLPDSVPARRVPGTALRRI